MTLYIRADNDGRPKLIFRASGTAFEMDVISGVEESCCEPDYIPYTVVESQFLNTLRTHSNIEQIRVDARGVFDRQFEDLFRMLKNMKTICSMAKIELIMNDSFFDTNGYMKEPNRDMAYNFLSQCNEVVQTGFVWVDGNRYPMVPQHWIPAAHRGYVMLEGGQYTPPMPPWSDSDQWVMLPANEDFNLAKRLALQTRQQVQHMQRDQFVISAAPSSVAQFMKLLRKVYNNDGYCPSVKEHLPQTKCMCEEFRNMEEGTCRCGLYKKHRRITHSEPKTPATMVQINRVLDESKEVL